MSSSHNSWVLGGRSIYGWGDNLYGQLGGDPPPHRVSTPKRIDFKVFPLQVSFGVGHAIILAADQSLYACGLNKAGQLGLGTHSTTEPLTKITSLSHISQIACGSSYSMALLRNGSLYTWGDNEYGQLGLPIPNNTPTPTPLNTIDGDIIQIGCGAAFSVVLTRDGYLYSWGQNDFFQLGRVDHVSTPQRVAGIQHVTHFSCGYRFVMALTREGDLYSWGNNEFGQLGFGHTPLVVTPTQVTSLPARVVMFCCGGYHSMAFLGDGGLYSWGWNRFGQLGVGSTAFQSGPTRVKEISGVVGMRCGLGHSMVISESNEVYCWGWNNCGQVGGNSTSEVCPRKILVKEGENVLLENDVVGFISLWPLFHYFLGEQTQKVVEEVSSIFKTLSIPKDLMIYFIKVYLQILLGSKVVKG